MIDLSALDKVIKGTLDDMENGKHKIFDIAETTRNESQRIERELKQVAGELRKFIDRVDELGIKEKRARGQLIRVSKNFQRHREEDIRDAYEKALSLQLQLRDLRNHEKMLRFRRDQLELSLKQMKTNLTRIENTLAHLSAAINYLSGNLLQVSLKIGELQQLHDLGVNIIRAQEEERKRVAREIHDGPAQMLANLVLRAEFCLKLLEIDPARLKEELSVLKELVRQSLQDIRKTIFDLRPMALDDLGLAVALNRYLADFQEQFGIAAGFTLFGEDRRLPVTTGTTLFRIVQECLHNVRKHAAARSVQVKLEIAPEKVNLSVKDDGRGFHLSPAGGTQHPEGYGLISIRERAQLLKGSVQIHTAPGKGTTVAVSIPLTE